MGEFWNARPNKTDSRFVENSNNLRAFNPNAVIAAHVYGTGRVSFESFTTAQHWMEYPALLKPMADEVYCLGVNHLTLHGYSYSRPETPKPGDVYFAGTHFDPGVTWWKCTIKAGSVYEGLVDFTDILPTCLELADVAPHQGVDGVSFAPQLQGKFGKPREWAFVLGGDRWFAREPKWKLNSGGQLFDVSDSPYVEALVKPEDDTPESKAARARLQAVLDKVHLEKRTPAKRKGPPPKEKAESDDGAE